MAGDGSSQLLLEFGKFYQDSLNIMSRIVFFLVLGIGIYLLIRHYARRSQSNNAGAAKSPVRDTIQCAQCKTYIPKDEAVAMHDQFFCCKQHARDWTPPDK